MNSPVLKALAIRYRKSRTSARDFTIEYETFLRDAGLADGDARELAENDLQLAERNSAGLLSMDRDIRTGQPLRIRLKINGGAAWLFSHIGESTPEDERTQLACFFHEAASMDFPNEPAWKEWCYALARNAANGGSIYPFKRNDPTGNQELMNILSATLSWKGESLIRFASSRICGNSKVLENAECRLVSAIRSIRGDENASLEDLGILKKPRTLHFHGPLVLEIDGDRIDFSLLPGPCGISEINLISASSVQTTAPLCLSVENEEVFIELAKQNPGWLMILTSFPGAAVRRLFAHIDPRIPCFHFGDSDPAGFDILRDLREKTGRNFQPLSMDFRSDPKSQPLSPEETKTLKRLMEHPLMTDVLPQLEEMLNAKSKGNFEQESVNLTNVLELGTMALANHMSVEE